MSDPVDNTWDQFFEQRTKTLWERFPGIYRALVVETNDPLNKYRVRIKCPDMHDWNLKDDECPWATHCEILGGQRAGAWTSPCKNDWVWITCERGHPYGLVWIGFATPTRRKMYPYPSVYTISPVPVNDTGNANFRAPTDYDEQYLPRDGRPMSTGVVDRYGNMDILSAVGFFPEEHQKQPAPPGHDGIKDQEFEGGKYPPIANFPDKKYMARVTKYGMMHIMSDQGYYWKKTTPTKSKPDDEVGEFYGSFDKDEQYETKRWLALQKYLNAGTPFKDHRRIATITRYGHLWEMRDTGWAQKGPVESKSRPGEFGPPRILSYESQLDLRWIKIRTKAGMLFQSSDIGSNPSEDVYVKRNLTEEAGLKTEQEDKYWKNKDARWMRLVTRYGIKFVLDDRGSSTTNAHEDDDQKGNGWLLKGRRSPGAKTIKAYGNPRGFFFEANENEEANHTMWGTPLGQTIELNDRYQYMLLATTLGNGWVQKWQGIKENEFSRKPGMIRDPERTSHHLKLDLDNEYIRLKTRSGHGPSPLYPVNQPDTGDSGVQQGLEAHDGVNGLGPWVELVDCEHRGLWFSKQKRLSIWRAKQGSSMFQWFDETNQTIVIYNNSSSGKIQLFSQAAVEIISDREVTLRSDAVVNVRAGQSIKMQAGGARLTLSPSGIQTNVPFNGPRVNAFLCGAFPGPGAGCPSPGGEEVTRVPRPVLPEVREPNDRGKTYNAPFVECPREEVEHPLRP